MTENEEVLKLAAKIYTFYFTKDGGYLELDPYDPHLVHMRSQCYKHAIAFCNEYSEHDVLDALKNFPRTVDELDKLYERLKEIAEKFHPDKKINIREEHIPLTNKSYEESINVVKLRKRRNNAIT